MLLDAIFRHESLENPQTGISAEMAEADGLFRSGTYVSPETSLKLAAVYSCITVLASNIAQMPLHVMRKTDKGVDIARDHPAFYLVHDEPNTWQTSYKWRELTQRHILWLYSRDALSSGRGAITRSLYAVGNHAD